MMAMVTMIGFMSMVAMIGVMAMIAMVAIKSLSSEGRSLPSPRRVRFSTTPCWSGRGYVLVAQVDPWVADPARHSVYRPRSRPVLGSIERGDQVRPGMVDPRTADPC